jgi:cytochrome c556
MNMRVMMAAGAAALLLTAAASQLVAKPKPAPQYLSAAEVVAARKAGMGLAAGVLGSFKGAVDSGAEVKPLGFPSRQLAKFAATIPSLFPAGTAMAGSEAKPGIWTSRADFEAKAAAFAAAATRLNAAAQAGDKAAFAAAWKETGGACKACHDTYRAESAH